MFATTIVNNSIEISNTHLVADAIAVSEANTEAQCERSLHSVSMIVSFDVCYHWMNSSVEINGTHLVADAMAVAEANAGAQGEWTLKP